MNPITKPTPSLAAQWLAAKEAEKAAEAKRRELEDQMTVLFGIDSALEGTANFDQTDPTSGQSFKVKVVGRMNRKVDGDTLQDLAREAGLEQYLTSLFRWSPELSLSAWKATSKEITDKLAPAITTTPGRPSFSVTPITEESAKEAQ